MILICTIIILIELCFFGYICYLKGLTHPHSIAYFIAYFYFNSVFVDYLLFNSTPTFVRNKVVIIDFSSYIFFEYCVLTFLFFVTYLILVLIYIRQIPRLHSFDNPTESFRNSKLLVINIVLILLCIYNVFEIISGFALTRSERGAEQTAITLVVRNTINYLFILIFCLKERKNWLIKVFIYSSICYFILSLEREPFIILFLCLLFRYPSLRKIKNLILGLTVLLLVMFSYKNFYSNFIYEQDAGVDNTKNFADNFSNSAFTFSGLDPQASFILAYDFIQDRSVYQDYTLTYITGVIYQIERMFTDSDYKTLAEYSSDYYAGGEYGTASSIILESLLNFAYLGPVFIACAIFYFVQLSFKYKTQFGVGIIVAVLYIISKFMRTEFATILKIQVFPLLIASYFFKKYYNKNKYV